MQRSRTLACILTTTLVVASCGVPLLQPRPTYGKSSSLTIKSVSGKREPSYLIAIDGTECTVSKKRFDKVKVGDNQWCVWSAPR